MGLLSYLARPMPCSPIGSSRDPSAIAPSFSASRLVILFMLVSLNRWHCQPEYFRMHFNQRWGTVIPT